MKNIEIPANILYKVSTKCKNFFFDFKVCKKTKEKNLVFCCLKVLRFERKKCATVHLCNYVDKYTYGEMEIRFCGHAEVSTPIT
jgi:hypothetical protein